MQVSEFINEAAQEIGQGWVQRAYANEQGVCVLGALDRVAMRHLAKGSVPVRAVAQQAIEQKASEMFPDVFCGSIPSLNDDHLTVKADMLALLEKTAIGLEEIGE